MSIFDPGALLQIPLFKDLNEEQLETVAGLLSPRKVPAGAELMHFDDAGEEICILLYGIVKVEIPNSGGGSTVVNIGGPGEVFGEMSVLDGQRRSATVTALEECGVFCVDRLDFWTTLWSMGPVPYNMVCLLNKRMRFVTGQLNALRQLSTPVRVGHQLAFLFEEMGLPTGLLIYLPFQLPVKDLASLANADENEVHQLLTRWRGQGILGTDGAGRFAVRSVEALRQVDG